MSAFNSAAPILRAEDSAAFAGDAELRESLRRSLRRILRFYGFDLEGTGHRASVVRRPDFDTRAENWVTPQNHNFLRITRILRSLSLLGLADEARAFLAALEALYKEARAERIIGARTLAFWRNAVPPA